MDIFKKKLEYPVKIAHPNAAAAKVIISQLGGPNPFKILFYLKLLQSLTGVFLSRSKKNRLQFYDFFLLKNGQSKSSANRAIL